MAAPLDRPVPAARPSPLDLLGRVYEQPPVVIDRDHALTYARATNDDNPAYAQGGVLPPLFAVVPPWPAFGAAVSDVVPDEARPRLLHAAHDLRVHRPLVAGDEVLPRAEVAGVRASRAGAWIVLRIESRVGAELANEQLATLFVGRLEAGGSGGDAIPAHPFPATARAAPVDEVAYAIDHDQARRYARASGDDNPIHVDDEAARAAGLPGASLPGLCTMAFCGKAVVSAAAGGDPRRLRRLALRFAKPVLPGATLATTVFSVGTGTQPGGEPLRTLAFEATSEGQRVVKDGWAEVLDEGRG